MGIVPSKINQAKGRQMTKLVERANDTAVEPALIQNGGTSREYTERGAVLAGHVTDRAVDAALIHGSHLRDHTER